MENQLGTENLKKVVFLALELGNVADRMGRSKGAARYGHLLMLMDEVTTLGSVDFKAVLPEFKDLDASEKATLLAEVKTKFDLENDALEVAIEEGLMILQDGASVVERAINLVKLLKKS